MRRPYQSLRAPGGRVELVSFSEQHTAAVRLLCIPCAGRGPVGFSLWPEELPGVEVWGARLPGRETLFRATPLTELYVAVEEIVAALRVLPPLPLAVFGHSMGALIGFELLRSLRGDAETLVRHLFVAARVAPSLQSRTSQIFRYSDERFAQEVASYGGVTDSALSHDLVQAALPALRADFQLVETYEPHREPLACGITAIGGHEDPFATEPMLRGWQRHTHGAFLFRQLPGGHFFVDAQRPQITSLIAAELACTAGTEQSPSLSCFTPGSTETRAADAR